MNAALAISSLAKNQTDKYKSDMQTAINSSTALVNQASDDLQLLADQVSQTVMNTTNNVTSLVSQIEDKQDQLARDIISLTSNTKSQVTGMVDTYLHNVPNRDLTYRLKVADVYLPTVPPRIQI